MLIGYKRGMTQYFVDNVVVPVTVIEFLPNVVIQTKSCFEKSFTSVQISTGLKKNLSKSVLGHLKKANVKKSSILREFKFCNVSYNVGDVLNLNILSDVKKIDVTGVSKGKGFAGVIKRHNFRMQPASHGNSKTHRAPGSIGQCQTPGRVFKGKKMPGRLGNCQTTIKNLNIVDINFEKNFILVSGSVPGCVNGVLFIKRSLRVR